MSKSVATATTTSSRKTILKKKPRATKSEVEAARAAGRVLLCQLCADEGIEEADPDGVLDAAFGTRYAVINYKDNHKPHVVVRCGKKWERACAERGCTRVMQRAPGTANTHCQRHGNTEVAVKRAAGRVLLAQLCADEGIEEADPDGARDAAFGKRYAVLNCKDNQKPHVMVRSGKQWLRACAERGCTTVRECAPGTPNTHCTKHGGGGGEVAAKRAAGRVLLAQLCADEGIEEADPNGARDAAFGKRYAVLNEQDNHKPRVVVRAGKSWARACAERGCPSAVQHAPGTPNTHCNWTRRGPPLPGGAQRRGVPLEQLHHRARVRWSSALPQGRRAVLLRLLLCGLSRRRAGQERQEAHARQGAGGARLPREALGGVAPGTQVGHGPARRGHAPSPRPPATHSPAGYQLARLVLESDENSHWFYLCADERNKEKKVHFCINRCTKPLFFVRMNTDAYDDPVTGKRVPSCWGIGKDGIARVKLGHEAEWEARLEKLAQVVDEYLVDYTATWAAWDEADRPKPEVHTIELSTTTSRCRGQRCSCDQHGGVQGEEAQGQGSGGQGSAINCSSPLILKKSN